MARGVTSVEVRAGFVVFIGITILILGLFLVSGGSDRLAAKKIYTVWLQDVGGAVVGDVVYVDGKKAGKVFSVAEKSEPRTKDGVRAAYTAVKIQLSAGIELKTDATFRVSQSITNIVTVHGKSGDAAKVAGEGAEFWGEKMANFQELVDAGYKLVDDVKIGVGQFNEVMTKVNKEVDHLDIKGLRAEAGEVMASIKRSAEKIEKIISDNEEPIGNIVRNVEDGSVSLKNTLQRIEKDWPELDKKAETVIDSAAEVLKHIDETILENRPTIKSAIQQLDDGLRRLGPMLEQFEGAGKEAKEILIELRPKLVKGLGDAARAMENFKEATEDLKTAPWKLINKPSGKESDDVHFYNATRLYLDSAEKIGEVIRDLETLRKLGLMDDPAQTEVVTKTLAVLQQSLKDFEARQSEVAALMAAREKDAK